MLSLYQPTETELWLSDLYQAFGIHYSHELDLDTVCMIWGIDIVYYSGKPFTQWDEAGAVVMLNELATPEENRSIFYHELCHIVKHVGSQDELPQMFVELQEMQAAKFQLVAAMPYYLLPEPAATVTWHEYAGLLASEFSVTCELAYRRAQQIESRLSASYTL